MISSQLFQPTSPTQISFVPGRKAIRNGLRSPVAMIRRAFGSEDEARGFPEAATPVTGSSRSTEPLSPTGSPLVRRSCDRRAPPSAVGGVWLPPTPDGGSPHGFFGLPSWP